MQVGAERDMPALRHCHAKHGRMARPKRVDFAVTQVAIENFVNSWAIASENIGSNDWGAFVVPAYSLFGHQPAV